MPVKKPLRIDFVFDDSLDSFDGVSQYVKILGGWLSQKGHKVRYLTGQSSLKSWHGAPVISMSKNIRVLFNGNRASIPLPVSKRRIKKVLKSSPDILHVQVPYSPFMAQRIISAVKPNCTVIGTFHVYPANRWVKIGSKVLKLMYLNSLDRFDQMISVSTAAQQFARLTFGLESIVLPNVVNIDKFKNSERVIPGHIVFLGRLVKRKGCEQLIKAFRPVSQQVPSARLTVAGDGPQRQHLEKLVKELDLEYKVTFRGFIEEADKPKLLGSAQIACFPSLYGESFGIVLIEAMAAGSGVVIGGNNPGYASVIGHQEELLFEPYDSAGLGQLIVDLLKDDKRAQKLHDWQQEHVQLYDVNYVGQQIEKLYYRLNCAKNAEKA